jgi:hypothetical protein
VTTAASAEYGNATYTARALINAGDQRVYNESKHFAKNGLGVKHGTRYAESVKFKF